MAIEHDTDMKTELNAREIEAVDMELEKAAAIVELITRCGNENQEDPQMIKSAALVALEIVEAARAMLAKAA